MKKRHIFLWHILSALFIRFQNIAHLLALAGMILALILAFQDHERTEVLLIISVSIAAELFGFVADIISRFASDRERKIINDELADLRQKANDFSHLLEPRKINPESKTQLISKLKEQKFSNAKINFCYDSGFDSATYSKEFLEVFSSAGWKSEDEGSLMWSATDFRGIHLFCNPTMKSVAEFIQNAVRQSGEQLVEVHAQDSRKDAVIQFTVYRDPSKLGGG